MLTVSSGWCEVREAVWTALTELRERERPLFANRANERSITHWLAVRLMSQFPGWDVDCEYNRIGDDRTEYKHLFLEPHESGAVDVFDPEGSRVYPDVVIHRRGQNGREDNLLVIEVKPTWSGRGSDRDIRKLRAFTGQVAVRQIVTYQYGLFLVFDDDGSVADWQHFARP